MPYYRERGYIVSENRTKPMVAQSAEYMAATAHVRMDGHEALCMQQNKHVQHALETLTESIKALTSSVASTNSRIHERIDKLMWGISGLLVTGLGAVIFIIAQWLWEALRYKTGG